MKNSEVLSESEDIDECSSLNELVKCEKTEKNEEKEVNNKEENLEYDDIKIHKIEEETSNNVSENSKECINEGDKKFVENYVKKGMLKTYPNTLDSYININEGFEFGFIVFVVQALESILSTKEGKKNGPLRDSIFKTLGK